MHAYEVCKICEKWTLTRYTLCWEKKKLHNRKLIDTFAIGFLSNAAHFTTFQRAIRNAIFFENIVAKLFQSLRKVIMRARTQRILWQSEIWYS